VAMVSRIDKMIGLFCKRALSKRRYSAKETYHLIEPIDRSHPIATLCMCMCMCLCPCVCMYVYMSVSVCV